VATRTSTRTRLLDAADELLFSQGVVATPVDEVLRRAGASPATLYRAYGSKEGLVAAALERRHQRWCEVWDEAVAEADGAVDRLLAVFTALDRFRARSDGARWCAFLGTAAEYADPPAPLAEALRLESTTMRERLTALAEPVAGPRADELAQALVLLVSGQLALRLRGDGDPGLGRRVAESLLSDRRWRG
jgi:AcrR family transcriptional regulator